MANSKIVEAKKNVLVSEYDFVSITKRILEIMGQVSHKNGYPGSLFELSIFLQRIIEGNYSLGETEYSILVGGMDWEELYKLLLDYCKKSYMVGNFFRRKDIRETLPFSSKPYSIRFKLLNLSWILKKYKGISFDLPQYLYGLGLGYEPLPLESEPIINMLFSKREANPGILLLHKPVGFSDSGAQQINWATVLANRGGLPYFGTYNQIDYIDPEEIRYVAVRLSDKAE